MGNECLCSSASLPSHCNQKYTMRFNIFVLDRILSQSGTFKRFLLKTAFPLNLSLRLPPIPQSENSLLNVLHGIRRISRSPEQDPGRQGCPASTTPHGMPWRCPSQKMKRTTRLTISSRFPSQSLSNVPSSAAAGDTIGEPFLSYSPFPLIGGYLIRNSLSLQRCTKLRRRQKCSTIQCAKTVGLT